jgi:hypothetical protein
MQIRSFTVGKSTIADVQAALGPPTSLIPIAGAFVGGSDTEASVVSFTFNHGVLANTSESQTNMDMTNGR